jgi:hypothetical protein
VQPSIRVGWIISSVSWLMTGRAELSKLAEPNPVLSSLTDSRRGSGFVQHHDKKKYVKPRLRAIDPALLSSDGWNREQLLKVRDLVTRAIDLAEAEDQLSEVAAKLRSTLSELDDDLARSDEAGSHV